MRMIHNQLQIKLWWKPWWRIILLGRLFGINFILSFGFICMTMISTIFSVSALIQPPLELWSLPMHHQAVEYATEASLAYPKRFLVLWNTQGTQILWQVYLINVTIHYLSCGKEYSFPSPHCAINISQQPHPEHLNPAPPVRWPLSPLIAYFTNYNHKCKAIKPDPQHPNQNHQINNKLEPQPPITPWFGDTSD